jgi:hypothetical protein
MISVRGSRTAFYKRQALVSYQKLREIPGSSPRMTEPDGSPGLRSMSLPEDDGWRQRIVALGRNPVSSTAA